MAKNVCIITASEIQNAALHILLKNKAFHGKFVAAYEFEWEPENAQADLRVRARVVMFDTEAAAVAYLAGDDNPEDVAPAAPAAQPSGDSLEGGKHGG